jgi:mannose-6-phosphate isomerase-like protein (cupin superfamily)
MVIAVDGRASRGAYSLIEYSHVPGAAGPPAHVHHQHEEAFYVLEGELTLQVGQVSVVVPAGQTAVVPRGSVHRPSNPSRVSVRFLLMSSPPMDEFFVALGHLVADSGGRPTASALRALGEQYDSFFTELSGDRVEMDNEHG